jgi:type IV secretion system protein VirB3
MRSIPIRQSLLRPNLIWGAEREPILMCALLCFTLGYTLSLPAIISALILWVICIVAGRAMDPRMINIYKRSRKYRSVYCARSTPFCKNKR